MAKKKSSMIDEEIEEVLFKMRGMKPESDAYTAAAKNLETLYKARSYKNENRVSPDTIAIVVANILGILLTLNYEHIHIVSSKAINFILKPKI